MCTRRAVSIADLGLQIEDTFLPDPHSTIRIPETVLMARLDEHDILPPSVDPVADDGIVEPPSDLLGIMKRLGPGLIIAGGIVGSGELIATTKTGAQAGMTSLLGADLACRMSVGFVVER